MLGAQTKRCQAPELTGDPVRLGDSPGDVTTRETETSLLIGSHGRDGALEFVEVRKGEEEGDE